MKTVRPLSIFLLFFSLSFNASPAHASLKGTLPTIGIGVLCFLVGRFTQFPAPAADSISPDKKGDLPRIVFYSEEKEELKLVQCHDTVCSNVSLLPLSDPGRDTGHEPLQVDNKELKVISYYDVVEGTIKLAVCSDSGESNSLTQEITSTEISPPSKRELSDSDRDSAVAENSFWDVSKVENAMKMFLDAPSYNQDISGWSTSEVPDMSNMFETAPSFNQDLGGWDVSKVENTMKMFEDAQSYNQTLCSWGLSSDAGQDKASSPSFRQAPSDDIHTGSKQSIVHEDEPIYSFTDLDFYFVGAFVAVFFLGVSGYLFIAYAREALQKYFSAEERFIKLITRFEAKDAKVLLTVEDKRRLYQRVAACLKVRHDKKALLTRFLFDSYVQETKGELLRFIESKPSFLEKNYISHFQEGNPNPEENLKGGISLDLVTKAVTTYQGQTYQKEQIKKWLEQRSSDPITRSFLDTDQLYPNYIARALVQLYKREQ